MARTWPGPQVFWCASQCTFHSSTVSDLYVPSPEKLLELETEVVLVHDRRGETTQSTAFMSGQERQPRLQTLKTPLQPPSDLAASLGQRVYIVCHHKTKSTCLPFL